MAFRILILICAIAMVASLFLPWLHGPAGNFLVPWDFLKQLDPDQGWRLLQQSPPEIWVAAGSFALAALLALACLLGIEGKLLALLTGVVPPGMVVYGSLQGANRLNDLGLPQLRITDWRALLEQVQQSFGPGLYAWLGGACVILILSLLDPGRRAR